MEGLIADYLLLGWVAISIFSTGIAVCRLLSPFRGIDLVGYGAGAGVAVQAMFGLCLAIAPAARVAVVAFHLLTTIIALVYLWRAAVMRELRSTLSRGLVLAFAVWVVFAVACVSITHLDVTLPPRLEDGPYVFKDHTVNVKIQYLTGMPADNFIPYVVAEYLLRGISFRKERPILPGNEVSNRTILLPLTALPYRSALSPPPRATGPLGKFEYVGQLWPAVGQLYQERYYRQLLVVGIFLNSLPLLGLLVLFQGRSADTVLLPGASLLYLTNPFLIAHTIFIWPKAFAGFFLLLAWRSARVGHHPALVGGCAAMAFHAHPYAGLFAGGLGLFYAFQSWRDRKALRSILLFALTFLLLVAPWFFWTHLILNVPSNMLWQNIAGPGTDAALTLPLNFVWVRLRNLFELSVPMMFAVYPFDARSVIAAANVCLPGTVGLFLIGPALYQAVESRSLRWLAGLAVALPALMIVAIFSLPQMPIVHGFQPIVGLLIFCGLVNLRRMLSPLSYWTLVTLQLVCNLVLIGMHAAVAGVRFPSPGG